MESKNKSLMSLFIFSLICMIIFAASFLLMPVANSISLNEGKNGFLYTVGIMFWGSLLVSQVLTLLVSIKRKKGCEKRDTQKLPGIVSFFSNKEARIADILAAIFIVIFAVCVFATDSYLIYVFMFLSVLLFEAHCVLNGKNYKYIKDLISGGNEQ